MERIGQPLQQLLRRLGVEGTMRGYRAVELWPEVAGERVLEHARAVSFREGVLVVEVDNPAWMNELTYLRHRMVTELNRKLGEDAVREVHLRPSKGSASPSRPRAGGTSPIRKP